MISDTTPKGSVGVNEYENRLKLPLAQLGMSTDETRVGRQSAADLQMEGGEVYEEEEEFWTSEEIVNWYERGSEKLQEFFRLDKLIPILLDINAYFSEVQGINLQGFD